MLPRTSDQVEDEALASNDGVSVDLDITDADVDGCLSGVQKKVKAGLSGPSTLKGK